MHAIALLVLVFPADWFPAAPADLSNFPPHGMAVQQCFITRQAVTEAFGTDRAHGAEHREAAWRWLLGAHTSTTDLSRSQYLTWLRRHLGDEAYYAGRMP